LICDREAEVEGFKAEEYWSLDVELKKGKGSFLAQLVPQSEDKIIFRTEAEVKAFMASLAGKKYVVTDVKTVDKILNPRAPYTTSKLQQDAAIRLGFTSKKTMQLAQQLYEGINLGSNRVGLITYMRTDSTRISNQALADVRDYIGKNFPQELPAHFNNYSLGKRAQDAHEAIRPTYVKYTPDSVKQYLTADQYKLYTIIWERFVSSQMKDSVLAVTTVDINCGGKPFRTVASVVKEKGFQAVLKMLAIKEKSVHLPALAAGDELEYCKYDTEQHFTQGPSRYTDASIVKVMEEKGIGRPSTYAPIITLLIERYYVARKNKQLIPTQLGRMINKILLEKFPKILDVNFTAEMEQKLDDVEESKDNWSQMIGEFYKPFKEQVDHVMATLESQRGSMDELTEYKCDKCGRPMVKKLGRFGHFLACSGFPECKNTQSIPFCKCPRPGCDGQIVARKKHGGKGREFYGCTNYPKCDFISAYKPTKKICPDCGYFMVERYEKSRGSFYSCSNTECKNHVKEE
ncbi:MAG: type I DNA topoisomerase, partial [Spirochaetia bacterium]|nr:type I DNA topoisomerase [Spirochaetia bacterium]